MEEDDFYLKLKQTLGELPENYTVLEDQVDVSVQMRYYNFSSRLRKRGPYVFSEDDVEALFSAETSLRDRKRILVNLASLEDVGAYRIVERYCKNPGPGMKSWSILAFQESKMRLQSSILEEQQVIISTGLGGKGKKLRYYIVFLNADENVILNLTQQKLLHSEVIYALSKKEGELEGIDFMKGFTACTLVLPLKTDLGSLFREIIDECNQYGGFLKDDLVITNVKKLNRKEILEMLKARKNDPDDVFDVN